MCACITCEMTRIMVLNSIFHIYIYNKIDLLKASALSFYCQLFGSVGKIQM